MVKIIARSSKDIVEAYLKCLGFDKASDVTKLSQYYPDLLQCSDVVVYLDNLLYKTAHKIWKKQADKEQSVAMLKALFCELKVPQKWGIKVLFPEFEDSEFTRLMQNSFFESVPPCVFSEMPTQAIESYKFPLASKLKATLVKQES